MKFILDGGWDPKNVDSVKDNLFVRYNNFLMEELKNKKSILIITNVKPVNNYKSRIESLISLGADLIGLNTVGDVDFGKYDYIVTLGGETLMLFNDLIRLDFKIGKLKENVIYIGSSAGTKIMSSYFCKYDKITGVVDFYKGFIPENKEIYLVHDNNISYVDDVLRQKVKEFAQENGLVVVPINENETIEREFN